ncbi:MAG: SBBP repeat-containing protein, partial [Planctomycetes bacterium]|nr:SBBP repeat-containing protein [Planctomycetota bacterium]
MKTTSLVALLSLALSCASSARGETLEWIRQFGTSSNEEGWDVSADGLGNVYFSGSTEGSLEGTSAGGRDAFISKYDDSGTLQWTRQLGTSSRDVFNGVSADGLGNVYVSGETNGSLGGTNAGGGDVFISKYDDSGTLAWTRQLGTSGTDRGWDVSADGLGNVYISGVTGGSLEGTSAGADDAFVSKYDAGGVLQWSRQLGTSEWDHSRAVSADGLGNVYISGYTTGSLGGTHAGCRTDAFINKYDASGSLRYDPDSTYAGQDSFTYRVSDGQCFSNVASVEITVVPLPPSLNPTAIDDTASVGEDGLLTVTLSKSIVNNDIPSPSDVGI